MIPKKIHYCWFGRNPLPKSAKKCIASWKKYFPDYEIIEWNEDNYDVGKIPYLAQAYSAKKYAYVSDYARYDILYHEGGIYFDTDVEVICSFEDILDKGAFLGCEIDGKYSVYESDKLQNLDNKDYSFFKIRVAPGLGMATEPGNSLYLEFLQMYKEVNFIKPDGSFNTVAVVRNTTTLLTKYGLKDVNGIQKIGGINIYPSEYFNPLDSTTGLINKTDQTHSIHWYMLSWMSPSQRLRVTLAKKIRKVLKLSAKIKFT